MMTMTTNGKKFRLSTASSSKILKRIKQIIFIKEEKMHTFIAKQFKKKFEQITIDNKKRKRSFNIFILNY